MVRFLANHDQEARIFDIWWDCMPGEGERKGLEGGQYLYKATLAHRADKRS